MSENAAGSFFSQIEILARQARDNDLANGRRLHEYMSFCDASGAEIDRLKAELDEAREIIRFTSEHGAFPSGIRHRARDFLNRGGK